MSSLIQDITARCKPNQPASYICLAQFEDIKKKTFCLLHTFVKVSIVVVVVVVVVTPICQSMKPHVYYNNGKRKGRGGLCVLIRQAIININFPTYGTKISIKQTSPLQGTYCNNQTDMAIGM